MNYNYVAHIGLVNILLRVFCYVGLMSVKVLIYPAQNFYA